MHILHATEIWLPATENWLHTQIAQLPADITSHLVCTRTENTDRANLHNGYVLRDEGPLRYGVEVAMRRLRLSRGLPFVAHVAELTGANLLHSHFATNGWRNMPAAANAGLPHVVSFYGNDVDHLPANHLEWTGRYAELFAFSDRILCEGPYMARRLAARGCPPERIRIHHLGIDLDRFRYRPRFRAAGDPLRVLLAARFRERAGLPDALAALGRIRKDVALEITVIGDANQTTAAQAEKARIRETVHRSGLDMQVRFLGFQSHDRIHEEAARHHVFVQTSRQARDGDSEGGVPVLLMEMAASGMPIVATTHCDIPEAIRHGQTGLLAPEGEVDTIADHLLWLARRPDHWRPVLDAARAHIEREFDARRQGERLADLYGGLLGRSRAPAPLPKAA